MSDEIRYYYMRLKDNFFERDEIRIIESQENGYIYSNILLKLYLKALKHKGVVQFNDKIPYKPEILATIINHDVDHIRTAIKLAEGLDLLELDEAGKIFIHDLQNYIGESSTEADRKRLSRLAAREGKADKTLEIEAPGQMSDERPTKLSITNRLIDKELKSKEKKEAFFSLPHSTLFASKWAEWTSYRTEIKKPLKSTTVKMQLKLCAELTEVEAVDMIDRSMASGWIGLFKPKENQLKKSSNLPDPSAVKW